MAIETERKFLVKNDGFLPASVGHARIAQGYLSTDPARTVRVRIKGEKAFLTIKGASDPSGVSRGEWEYGIPVEDARELLALCGERIIDKTRYDVPVGSGQFFTVDVFYGQNEGLVLAEIELSRPDEPFERPNWLGEEVTGDPRYYNSALIACPYKQWR